MSIDIYNSSRYTKMYIKEVITQERKIPAHATIARKRYVGPLGTARYLLHSDQEIEVEEAVPFKVVLLSALLDSYSIAHFTEMLRYFLVKTVYCDPTGFIVNKYAYTKTTHIYPVYRDEYIYMCEEERNLAMLNPIVLLGLCPVTNDPLCWFSMRIPNAMHWDDVCVVQSSERHKLSQEIYDTIAETGKRRIEGERPELDPPVLLYTR